MKSTYDSGLIHSELSNINAGLSPSTSTNLFTNSFTSALLCATCSFVSILRISFFPVGSPINAVAPPITIIG